MRDNDPDVLDDFYVYLHKEKHPGIIFYVGKGRGDRACDRNSRNQYWKDRVNALGGDFEIEIVKKNLLEDEALLLEHQLIAKYGKVHDKTGTLVNWTDGGDSEVAVYFTPFSSVAADSDESFDDYVCLKGKVRDRFANDLFKAIDCLSKEFDEAFGDECEDEDYEFLEGEINSFWELAEKYKRKRVSSKVVAGELDYFLETLSDFMEDPEFEDSIGIDIVQRGRSKLVTLREAIRKQ